MEAFGKEERLAKIVETVKKFKGNVLKFSAIKYFLCYLMTAFLSLTLNLQCLEKGFKSIFLLPLPRIDVDPNLVQQLGDKLKTAAISV